MKTQLAQLNYLHITPRKVRLVTDTLKGLPIREAEAQLYLRTMRSSKPLLKLLRSAVANAKGKQMDARIKRAWRAFFDSVRAENALIEECSKSFALQ